jgi:CheY-like chemotaxis protein
MPDRLQQVVWNLMSNAIKFTEAGGRVDVQVSVVGPTVEIVVADTGEGISRDFLPYLFDRFRQADSSPSRRHGGLGLGLALVRQIAELHGGSVHAESGGAGRGSTIFLRLPMASERAEAEPREKKDAGPVTLKGIAVLVVDDNDDGREMLAAVLRGYGAKVRSVSTAREALTLVANSTYDVLISDVGMPETDGYELIRRIRMSAEKTTNQMPAIAITAYANPEDRIRAVVAGFQAHLPKPVDAATVAVTIVGLVSAKPPAA